jgi:hypothetical protein
LKLIKNFIIICFFSVVAFAQSPITLSIVPNSSGKLIPADFPGESFETGSLIYNTHGVKGYLFDSTNKQLVNLFRELGLKNLRIGGGSVDHNKIVPVYPDIDALFGFAKVAGVKIVYSLRLTNGNASENASIAKYIWQKYRPFLDCYAIGNEPDWHSFHIEDSLIYETIPGIPGSAYPSYIAKWKKFAKAVLDLVPDAKFTGPNSGSNYPITGAKNTGYDHKSWTTNFADDEKNSGIISFISQHNYVGQSTDGMTVQEVINKMLSPVWVSDYYPALYNESCATVLADGFPFRLTESNCFSGGIDGGSNSFATALFALDYMHWWAAHNASGINFHTTQWRFNGTFRLDKDANVQINPMGYGIKAFSIGGQGKVESVKISNPDSLNLTSYAVLDTNYLYITIINKEHKTGSRDANVSLISPDGSKNANVIFLSAPDGVSAKDKVTLGGAEIKNDGQWNGQWNPVSVNSGIYNVRVPAASAAIVKISIQNKNH